MEVKTATDAAAQVQDQPKGTTTSTWRPMLIGNRMRTTSEDSADTFDAYTSLESPTTFERRFSLTEKFFGSSMPGGGRRSSATEFDSAGVSKNMDLKQFMKRQRNILGDDEWQ